ncbi:MAG: hypothetical protein FJ288_17850 [Planctomycetes bacterium]|nr:hypothetical protein [Planctomycetota bacterium]
MAKKAKKADGYIDLSAAQKAQHEAWRPLTVHEANRLAKSRWKTVKVRRDPEDARLWRVERPGSVQAHEPMTREAWLAFLETGEATPTKSAQGGSASGGDGQTAAEVYAERRRDIDRLLEWLGQELRKHEKEARAKPRNWGASGDLYRVRSGLIEVLAALRGVEIEDIERCL